MNYPPYGFMPEEWHAEKDLSKPDRFTNADGTPATEPQWIAWHDAMADDLAAFLWPRFVGGVWLGAAQGSMDALTGADLELMGPMFDTLAQVIAGTSLKHEQMFLAEDPRPPNVGGMLIYAPNAPNELVQHFDKLVMDGVARIGFPATINLKRRMQRPRAYQVALLVAPGRPFRYRAASSATSPAMVSGHCLQASMALVNVVAEHEAEQGPLPAAVVSRLQQYFIDAGDRRVFAGVHYPSDNISSWYAGLRLCCHVFDTEAKRARARQVLWDAISQKSTVYLALKQAVLNDAASPFAVPLQRLAAQAAAPCVSALAPVAQAARANRSVEAVAARRRQPSKKR
jgi:hypothetical protein